MSNRTVVVALRAVTTGFDGPLLASQAHVEALNTKVGRTALNTQKDMHLMGNATERFGGVMKALPLAAAGAGAGIAAALGYGVVKAVEFDKQMHNVNSISGLSQHALGQLGDQVVKMSEQFPQSASTLAEGLYNIASSGFQGADGMKVLKAAATSASAGMTDTATAAQAITAVLNAYNLSASQAGDVSDQLFQTVNLGVTDFASLAHNVGDYIGQAHALGLSFAQTQSAIATLTLTGTTQAQAGTALGSVLNSLIRPQQGLAQAIQATGYSSGDAMIKALGLRGTLMKLAEATGGSASKMGQLFTDSQALRSALQLTSNGGAKWAEVAAKIEDPTQRAGAAQKALAEQSKSLSFQLDVARNKVDAAAITLGRKLLPALAQALAAGISFGEGLPRALEPLKPLVEDLWHALGNLVHIGADLVHMFGPLALDLARLAATPIVGVMMALARVLDDVTGLLADHETLVATLAIAYGITLAGGVSKAAWSLAGLLVTALGKAVDGLEGMTMRAGGARVAMMGLAASIGPALAVGGTIALALTAWHNYSTGAHEAEDATKKAFDAFKKPGDLKGFEQARNEVDKMRDELQTFAQQQKDKPWWQNILDIGDTAKAVGVGQHLSDLQRQAADNDDAWLKFKTTVNSVIESSIPLGEVQDKFHNTMVLTGKAFSDAMPMLEKAGVKVSDSFATIQEKVTAYKQSMEGAAGGSKNVVTALQEIQTGATDTATAVDKLTEGLDALLGIFLDADSANIKFEAALDDLTATLKKNGHTLDENTDKGRANREAIIGGVSALKDKVEADAKAGKSGADLAKELETGRARLIAQATAAGMTKGAIEKLLAQYNLTPAQITTIVQALGVTPATKNVKGLNTALDNTGKKNAKPKVNTAQLRDAQAKADLLLARLGEIDRKPVTITIGMVVGAVRSAIPFGSHNAAAVTPAKGGLIRGPGTGTSDSIPAMVSNGEFVINAAATQANLSLLQAINSGSFRGAPASAAPALLAASSGGGGLNINGDIVFNEAGRSQPQTVVERMSEMAYRMGLR